MFKRNSALFGRVGLVLVLVMAVVGCSTVTIRPQGGSKDSSQPDYIDSKPFYLSGLIGKHKVNVNEVCEGDQVVQMQTVTTSSDWLLGVMTLFIYAPRTVKVWCKGGV